MPKIYHEKGLIHIEQDNNKFTISNYEEYFEIIKKINKTIFHSDEKINFQNKMAFLDMISHARRQMVEFQDKTLKSKP